MKFEVFICIFIKLNKVVDFFVFYGCGYIGGVSFFVGGFSEVGVNLFFGGFCYL